MRLKHIIDTPTEGGMGKVESPHPGRRGVGSVERLRLRWPMVEVEEKTEEKMGENAEAEVKWKLRKVGEKEKMVFCEAEEEEVVVKENIRNKKIEE